MRFLVALDGSQKDAAVLETAQKLGRAAGAEVVLLNVVNPWVDRPVAPATSAAEAEERLMEERQAYLDQRAATLADLPVTAVVEKRQRGEETDQCIARVARERQIDVVMVASKLVGGLQGLILGSVGQGVLRHSPSPVLVVRPK